MTSGSRSAWRSTVSIGSARDGTSIGFQLFDEWSATEPDLYSIDTAEKKWASFGRSGRSGISLGTLFHLAEQHGWQGLAPPAAPEPFSPFVDGGTNGHALNGHGPLPAALTAPNAESPLIDLNKKYAVIGDLGGKCLVLGWVPSKVDLGNHHSVVPVVQVVRRALCAQIRAGPEAKQGAAALTTKPEQLGAHWLKWGRRQTYDGIDLDPAGDRVLPNGALNLWRGFAVEAKAGGWPRMQAHIAEVLAEGDPAALDYIMKWSAWAVQHPGERAELALVFRGGKGSGKGTFAHALRRMFGTHGLHISNPKHLVGAFNAHLRNCLLLYADEAFWAGDKQGESTLKALITEIDVDDRAEGRGRGAMAQPHSPDHDRQRRMGGASLA